MHSFAANYAIPFCTKQKTTNKVISSWHTNVSHRQKMPIATVDVPWLLISDAIYVPCKAGWGCRNRRSFTEWHNSGLIGLFIVLAWNYQQCLLSIVSWRNYWAKFGIIRKNQLTYRQASCFVRQGDLGQCMSLGFDAFQDKCLRANYTRPHTVGVKQVHADATHVSALCLNRACIQSKVVTVARGLCIYSFCVYPPMPPSF